MRWRLNRVGILGARAAALVACLYGGRAVAGGYDTPTLHSARYIGMGGAAVGYVDDASAVFHNPAGMAQVPRLSLLGDFALLLATTHASPGVNARDLDSELTVAPVFLLGAAYRIADIFVAGLAVYPVASAGAKYKYTVGPLQLEDRASVRLVEISPALAVNLPAGVRLGLGYRITWTELQRFQGDRSAGGTTILDLDLSGFDFAGFRAGVQWTPLQGLQVGAVYRHRISTRVTDDHGVAAGLETTDLATTVVLPSRLGFGGRGDIGHFGAAVDLEVLFNSQNGAYPLEGTPPATPAQPSPPRVSVPNVFDWSNALILRVGFEYRLLAQAGSDRDRLALRVGYIRDGKTTNPHYPSAFGTPPGATHVVTGGAGWTQGRWSINLAYTYRAGSGDVTVQDVTAPGNQPCPLCSTAGKDPYRLSSHGMFADMRFQY